MAETILAKVPHQQSHGILARTQGRKRSNHIAIGIRRVRTTFQSSFRHLQLAVHPEPVFRIGSQTQFQ